MTTSAISPARVFQAPLTDDQYKNPESYGPGINFCVNADGHPYDPVTFDEIVPGMNIFHQQCSCKLAITKESLVRWTLQGHLICQICKDPLEKSDIISKSKMIAKTLMPYVTTAFAVISVGIFADYIDGGFNVYHGLNSILSLRVLIPVFKKTSELFIDSDFLPKVSRVFLKYVPTAMVAVCARTIVVNTLCDSSSPIIRIAGYITAAAVSLATFPIAIKLTSVASKIMNNVSSYFPSFLRRA